MDVTKVVFKGCLRRKPKDQEALYHLVYPDLKRLTRRYVINDDDAQEIINLALYKVLVKIDDFKGTYKNFGGWIKRITINESIDWIRRKESFLKKHVTVDFIEDMPGNFVQQHDDPEYILRLLEGLPLTTRTVFNLYVIDGYAHNEIANELGITEGNSKWHLHSARKQLKSLLVEKFAL